MRIKRWGPSRLVRFATHMVPFTLIVAVFMAMISVLLAILWSEGFPDSQLTSLLLDLARYK